jgi:hypothetical protein
MKALTLGSGAFGAVGEVIEIEIEIEIEVSIKMWLSIMKLFS